MSERLLRQAVEQAGEGLLLTDTAGAIVYANAAFARMSGHPAAGIPGRSFESSFAMDRTAADVRLDLRRTLANGRVWRGELSGTAPDGAPFAWRASITPIRDDEGGLAGCLVLCQDAAARDDLEARLRQSQKMEAVGRLAGGIAHDFNNLLTVIAGCSDQLAAGLGDRSPLRYAVEGVKAAASRASALTRQLLAFSRRQVLAPERLDLNAVVADVGTLLQRLIGANIRLAVNLAPNPARVSADRSQLEQILMNLAINGRDAMPGGGTLTLTTQVADLDETFASAHPGMVPGRYVVLTVEDEGCGMSRETMAHLFEPFFTTKPDGKGTGLGLSTIYGIVKQSGGYIYASSEPGAGSRFTVCLPPLEASDDEGRPTLPGESGEPEASAGGETLLVVDDDEGVRELACRTLRERGYLVLEAANGRAAIEAMERRGGSVDLVVSGLAMPGQDGGEMAAEIRRRRPGTRVLFMSGYGPPPGAPDTFLQKPFTPGELANAVRRALDAPAS